MPELALAVDIGGSLAKIGLVTGEGDIVDASTVPAPRTPAEYADLNRHMRELAAAAGEAPLAVGLSVAGLYDESRRVLTYHPNNPGLEGADFVEPLIEGFGGLPWVVERDINAGALGEYHFGVGRGSRRFLCVVLGTGVGAGVVIEGELLRFAYDGIGDPGYVVVDPGGLDCPGGSRGCLEAEVSSRTVARRTQALLECFPESQLVRRVAELWEGDARPVVEAAVEGDVLACRVMRDTGYLLGIGLSSLTSIFAPDTIAIAGGLVAHGEVLVDAARETFLAYTAPFYSRGVRVERAHLGGQANLVGAAVAALGARSRQGDALPA